MKSKTGNLNTVLWEPSQKNAAAANITAYLKWLKDEKGLNFETYAKLWQWSVDEIEDFWRSLWEYFQIKASKPFDRSKENAELQQALTSLRSAILVPYLDPDTTTGNLKAAQLWQDLINQKAELVFEKVPFSHPIWVVYSSGTTGLPKPLVHGHGGILLEFMKFLSLHLDLKPSDRFFWFSTTGWVMWNILQGGLLTGATSLLYDGNPGYPGMDVLWEYAEKSGMTVLGTSAAYLTACMNSQMEPGRNFNLSRLRIVESFLAVQIRPSTDSRSEWAAVRYTLQWRNCRKS